MNELEPFRRMRVNWSGALARLGPSRPSAVPVSAGRLGLMVVGAVAVIVLVALLYDARAIAWTHTLSPAVHGLFSRITRLGTSGWLLIPCGVVVIVVSLGDWRRVSRASAAAWWEIATFAGVLFAVVAVSGIVTDIIKPIVGRWRPGYVHDGVFVFSPLSLGGYSHYSFPSGHSTTAAAVAMLAAFVPGVITIPVVALAGLVALSRIVVNAHFPSDVVGGVFVGMGVGYVILRWARAAGLLFVDRDDGRVRSRFGVLRRLVRRHGAGALFAALWVALGRERQSPPAA